MDNVRSWLSSVDTLEPPSELWTVATERAERITEVPLQRSGRGPRLTPPGMPTGWRRVAVVVAAFAVFALAITFAWRIINRTGAVPAEPSPTLSQDADPFSQLAPGWTRLADPPELRCCAATAWTGSKFIMWGGQVAQSEQSSASGWIYDPATEAWSAMPASPLAPRSQAAGVWTGQELVVWGGGGADPIIRYPYHRYDDGAAFDPSTGGWRPLPPAPIDARQPFAVWTGSEMIVWGSQDREQRRVDGAAYDPASNTWRQIADAPVELTDATAVWTGQEMIVFGAALHGGNHAETNSAISIAYDPASDSWRELPDSNLDPNANDAIWIGDGLLAWDYNLDSQIYDPVTDRWSDLGKVPTDECEDVPQSVWAGAAYGELCGDLVTFDPVGVNWEHIDAPPMLSTGIYGAGATLLVGGVKGAFGDGEDWRLFAYRPHPAPAALAGSTIGSPETTQIPVGAFPQSVAAGQGAVWALVSNAGSAPNKIIRIDPSTNEIVARISLPESAVEVVAGDEGVWASVYSTRSGSPPYTPSVVRIDPDTNEIATTIENMGGPLTLGGGYVWGTVRVGNGSELVRLDPATGTTNRVQLDVLIRSMVVTDAGVWAVTIDPVSQDPDGGLVRIDPTTGDVVPVPTPMNGSIYGPVVGSDAVWVGICCPKSGNQISVVSLDPTTGAILHDPLIAANGLPFASGDGKLWLLSERGTLTALDESTFTWDVVVHSDWPAANTTAVFDEDQQAVWIANYRGTVTRVDFPR